ncbi:MAG: hypothetical protein GPJ54_22690 [Candidatus Heimdallarchaeota archaeon]|nr:hypothetical protein [Candidatus Heimdallarchaeota archaeon]
MIKNRPYFAISVVIVLLLTSGTFFLSSINDEEVLDPIGGTERPYYFRIELSQWSMKVTDLNRIEDLMLDGYSINEAFAESSYVGYLGKLEMGSQVFLQIYSLDVQHGISINELDIGISILEPTEDIDSTIPFFYDFYLPNTDTSITAYCQVYCGLGHSNMKLRFDVGDGKPQYGKLVFNVFLILTAIVGISFSYLISSPIKRKVYLTIQASSSIRPSKSSLTTFNLFDISRLSEKELIALRQGYLDISKTGVLLETFSALSVEKAKAWISNNKNSNNWNLIEF